MLDTYVLDSYAVLALLGGEAGSDEVASILRRSEDQGARVLMSWVNAGEVAYIIERRWGRAKVHQVLGLLEAVPIEWVAAGRELALRAAQITAQNPLAYADAFAAALALSVEGILITGDPEFGAVAGTVAIQWLPSEPTGQRA